MFFFFSKLGKAYTPLEVLALLSPMSFPLKTDNYKMKIITVTKICIMAFQLIFLPHLIFHDASYYFFWRILQNSGGDIHVSLNTLITFRQVLTFSENLW